MKFPFLAFNMNHKSLPLLHNSSNCLEEMSLFSLLSWFKEKTISLLLATNRYQSYYILWQAFSKQDQISCS